MAFQIRVEPSQHHFEIGEGESILDAALRHGLNLPYGCRDGACGSCRGKVLAGEIDHGRSPLLTLPANERAAGFAALLKEASLDQDAPVLTMSSTEAEAVKLFKQFRHGGL